MELILGGGSIGKAGWCDFRKGGGYADGKNSKKFFDFKNNFWKKFFIFLTFIFVSITNILNYFFILFFIYFIYFVDV